MTGRREFIRPPAPRRQSGFTYLAVLFGVALMGLGLAAVATVWETDLQREREKELLFIGEQFGIALWRYYEASPGPKELPRRLEDLLEDRRQQVTQRHLRQIFADPFTRERDWELELMGDRIVGIHSRSTRAPVMKRGFPSGWEAFADADGHDGWVFRSRDPRTKPSAQADPQAAAGGEPQPGEPAADSPKPQPSENAACDQQRTNDYGACNAAAGPANAAARQRCIASAALRYGECLHAGAATRPLLLP